MKLSAAIAIALIGVTSAPAFAGGPRFRGRTNTYHEEFCYRYKEQYVPGYYNKHGRYVGGYVKSKKEKVPCWSINRPSYPDRYEDPAPNVGGGVDDNSCVEGAVLVASLAVVLVQQHPVVMDAGGQSPWASLAAVCLDVRLMGMMLTTVPSKAYN